MNVKIKKFQSKTELMRHLLIETTLIAKKNSFSSICVTPQKKLLPYLNLIQKYWLKQKYVFNSLRWFISSEVIDSQNCTQIFYSRLKHNFFDHFPWSPINTFYPCTKGNIKENALIFERQIVSKNGLDLLVCVMDDSGQIVFLKNDLVPEKRMDVVKLSNEKNVLTLGMATILETKKIIVIYDGNNRELIEKITNPRIHLEHAISFLNYHADTTLLVLEQK
ncbi:sugar phosphate isomerase family [Mycoplasmopsis alligatoris]|nr:hypothetical protein [Mycoplasmopsis alligatoris]